MDGSLTLCPSCGLATLSLWTICRAISARLVRDRIEAAFARLKAMLRKIGERSVSGRWNIIAKLVDMFQPTECANYFRSCG